ncbi:hypothetical protein [Bacteroides sp. 51]|uniref:hypothetical protein n=1 Tax=Bacteroides sp. 51 TaxID=2302938 RepID=UPI0013D8069B|nr:hypothetical protein [Bacteroides sp. 51]
MKKLKEYREKYSSILIKLYHSFNPENTSLKVKIVSGILALLLSSLITYIKILLR